jgi:hypothetical protein
MLIMNFISELASVFGLTPWGWARESVAAAIDAMMTEGHMTTAISKSHGGQRGMFMRVTAMSFPTAVGVLEWETSGDHTVAIEFGVDSVVKSIKLGEDPSERFYDEVRGCSIRTLPAA